MSELYSDGKATRLRVGIVTIVCLAIMVLGYAWLREWFDNRKYDTCTVWFENANGIEPGDDVTLSGVKVGRVKSLAVADGGVIITFNAHFEEPLHAGTTFVLKESSLMGDKELEIHPGSGEEVFSFSPMPCGMVRTGLSGFIANVDGLVGRITSIVERLEGDDGLFDTIHETADSTRVLVNNLNRTVDSNRAPLHEAIVNLAATTRQTSRLLSDNAGAIDSTLAAMPPLADEARNALSRLNAAAGQLEGLAAEVRLGSGTAGRLVGDDELYQRLLSVTAEVDSLLTDIKKNPKKYFQVKVF